MQLGKRKVLTAFSTHFQLWKMLKLSNRDTFWNGSSCFPSEPVLNKPFVRHHKPHVWARARCSVTIPAPTHFAAFISPTAPVLIVRAGAGAVQGWATAALAREKIIITSLFSLPGCLTIHTATLFAALCESEAKDIAEMQPNYYCKHSFPFLPPATSRACLTPITFSALLF